ncbi:hypothetical protein E3N88_20758 [Mikania micrantha]|uniref:Tf2-1-like SH3-like domain-containing protein n=1 Tax=Mikania micrantha TaxID=192012 RepID=A0A5N6NKH4_9ASTR|nr:hypothetical protein E3N88_20758 [Mikania micrantha]
MIMETETYKSSYEFVVFSAFSGNNSMIQRGIHRRRRSSEILKRIGPVAYQLNLPTELDGVHNVFHVLNLKKCLSDETLIVPLDEIQVDEQLRFVEEPVEIMDREVKQLKQSKIPIVKVRWNSKRGPEFTWEREDQMMRKYPHLFKQTVSNADNNE